MIDRNRPTDPIWRSIESLRALTPRCVRFTRGVSRSGVAAIDESLAGTFSRARCGCASQSAAAVRCAAAQRRGVSSATCEIGVIGSRSRTSRRYPNVYSVRLVDGLRATELFERVALLDEFESPPDLVAHVHRRIHGSAVIPVWSMLTLGIIPTNVEEDSGYSFWLATSGAPTDRVLVEYVHRGTTTLGWIAVFDTFSSERTINVFKKKKLMPRMTDRLAQRIALDALPHLRTSGRSQSQ